VHRHRPDNGHERNDNETLVEIARVGTRFEADVLHAALEARGIRSCVLYTGKGGPGSARAIGQRVLVFEHDVAVAHELIRTSDAAS